MVLRMLIVLIAALPDLGAVVFVMSRPGPMRIFYLDVYESALDFVIPWDFLGLAFAVHVYLGVLAYRRRSLWIALGTMFLMTVSYGMSIILFAVSSLPDHWSTG